MAAFGLVCWGAWRWLLSSVPGCASGPVLYLAGGAVALYLVQGDWLMAAAGYAPVLPGRAGPAARGAALSGRGGGYRGGVIRFRAG